VSNNFGRNMILFSSEAIIHLSFFPRKVLRVKIKLYFSVKVTYN